MALIIKNSFLIIDSFKFECKIMSILVYLQDKREIRIN